MASCTNDSAKGIQAMSDLEKVGEALRKSLMRYEDNGRKRIAIYLAAMREIEKTVKP
jgi:hypothetical protein